jgi:hypothetical protein
VKARLFALATAALIAAPCLAAQDRSGAAGDSYDWSGKIPQDSWIQIYNLNGRIDVVAADGDQVEVHAVKRYKKGNAQDVRFQMSRDGENVIICALWSERASCDEDGAHYRGSSDDDEDHVDHSDVEVVFTVRLPRGVNVKASTVNGGVDVRGATSRVDASTVNGQIDAVSTSGPVSATTVNGNIDVEMKSLAGAGDMKFKTVNGSVRVTAPANLGADVSMSTVMGNVSSDFPLTLEGRISPRRIRASINGGGPNLTMSTVNGSVELRKHDG